MLSVYDFESYKQVLRSFISARRKADPIFSQSQLADRMGVQKSYLSRVLNGEAHLNADQLYLLAGEINLRDDEFDYLLLLLEIERCGLESRRQGLIRKRDEIRSAKMQSDQFLERTAAVPDIQAFTEYYANPLIPIVHMYLTMPKFLSNPSLAQTELGITPLQLQAALSSLEKCGVLVLDKKRYRLAKINLHLSPDSPLFKIYATQFRLMSIQHLQARSQDPDYFFTASFSTNEKTRREIKKRFLEFLRWMSQEVAKETPSNVYHLNFDLFKI